MILEMVYRIVFDVRRPNNSIDPRDIYLRSRQNSTPGHLQRPLEDKILIMDQHWS